jgi:hypothetical protein
MMRIETRLKQLEEKISSCPACAQRDRELSVCADEQTYLELFFARCDCCGRQRTFIDLVRAAGNLESAT